MNDDTLKYPMAQGQTKHVLPISMHRIDGDTVYIAGHGAVNENGDFVGDTLETQMRYTMDEFTKTLAKIGIAYENLMMVRAYIQNRRTFPLTIKSIGNISSNPTRRGRPSSIVFRWDCCLRLTPSEREKGVSGAHGAPLTAK